MNGETYFALGSRPYYNILFKWQTFVRQDWLKEVGYDHVPTTREEYLDAMQKIMDAGICEHPGGGTKLSGAGSGSEPFLQNHPSGRGRVGYVRRLQHRALGSEANKLLVKNANEDYNLGITNPEYYITDAETAKANFVNGKQYSYAMYIHQSAIS